MWLVFGGNFKWVYLNFPTYFSAPLGYKWRCLACTIQIWILIRETILNFWESIGELCAFLTSLILRVPWLPQVAACTLILESPSSKWHDHPTIPPSSWAFSSPSFLLFYVHVLPCCSCIFQFGNSSSFGLLRFFLNSAVHLWFFFLF